MPSIDRRFLPRRTVLAAFLLASCHAAGPIAPEAGQQAVHRDLPSDLSGPAGAASVAEHRSIRGRAIFPAAPGARQVQASAAQVTRRATVSLLDTATGEAFAGGHTDGTGAFTLAPNTTFNPAQGGFYHLRVTRNAGSTIGSNLVSMLTLLRWTAGGWASITNATGGAGEIVINPATTAVSLIQAEDETVGFTAVLGKVVGPPDYDSITAFGGYSAADVAGRVDAVKVKLTGDVDPLGDRPAGLGNLAPDDFGDPTRHHDYVITKAGVASTFVWVPVFTAFQLVNPGNSGAANAGMPVGYWVKNRPTGGVEGSDWVRETFGGFYVAKFEAARSDAFPGSSTGGSGATAGGSSTLKVQQYCVPWAEVTWDEASRACLGYDAHAHLLRDDEWTALAVWSMIHDVMVRGNDDNRTEPEDLGIAFVPDPTNVYRALTGSGTRGTWSGDANFTTHTGTTAGVYDLSGNLWEWTGALGSASGSATYVLDDVDMGTSVGAGYISALSTDPRLRRYGVPGSTTGTPAALFGGDQLWKRPAVVTKAIRGGGYSGGGQPRCVWALYLYLPRDGGGPNFGFRPALRF